MLQHIKDSVLVSQLDRDTIMQLQKVLNALEHPVGKVDGIAGSKTISAWAKYKTEQLYLNQPMLIGPRSAELLLEDYLEFLSKNRIYDPQEQKTNLDNIEVLPKGVAGSKSGRLMQMPSGVIRHSNELILPEKKIPLTYGEMTKEGVRVPKSLSVERNLYKIALEFGKIRYKAGVPLVITSGYRRLEDQAHNPHAAKNSRHLYGLAIDIASKHISIYELLKIVRAVSTTGAIGLGMRYGFVHRDLRENSSVVEFSYS